MPLRPDRRSPEAAAYRALYRTKAWQSLRVRAFARDMGVCAICKRLIIGRFDADHIQPHKGDRLLFFNLANVQVLHPSCHAATKQQQEVRGFSSQIGEDGWPTDPHHPTNRSRP